MKVKKSKYTYARKKSLVVQGIPLSIKVELQNQR